MDAADVLYGVSMGGDGVTKVVSRRLPREVEAGDDAEAADAPPRGRRRSPGSPRRSPTEGFAGPRPRAPPQPGKAEAA